MATETAPVMMDQQKQVPEEVDLSDVIKAIKDKLDLEERPIRWMLIREWKKYELMWRGIQNVFWSEVAHDWKRMDDPSLLDYDIPNGVDPEQYRQIINIFRAHGESIIAALTVSVPTLRCYPSDADKAEDILAAKGFTKLSDKIDKDIDATLKLVQILYNLYVFGIAFGYNYYETDSKYGYRKETQYGPVTRDKQIASCPDCDSEYDAEMTNQPCPSCSEMGGMDQQGNPLPPPNLMPDTIQETTTEEIGEIAVPKSQERIEIFGPLHVRIPHNLSSLENSPYLALEMELHYTILRSMFPDYADKIQGSQNLSDNDRWARNPLETGATTSSYCTYSRWWLRPCSYYILEAADEKLSALKEQYPDGLLAIFIDDVFIEARPEKLDDHWTVTESPLSQVLNAPSIGSGVAPIQEMRNELDALTMRSIKNGIPETFADPSVVNFDAYNKAPSEPGLLFPAKAKAGQALQNAFYTNTPTTLSKDVPAYRAQLDADAQFVSGAYPSVYGGPNDQGSKTASEYDQSRNQALQRLSLAWKMLNVFWSGVKKRAMLEYRENLTSDEQFVKYQGGSFVNVWIKREELSGEIGQIETETSDQFPVSWVQLRGLMLQLLQMNNQAFNAMLFAPENIGEMIKTIGWQDLQVPGENDRNKQLAEIGSMLKGMPAQVDPELDNHAVHIEILKNFLNSPEGIDLQQTNQQAYMMLRQHFQEHMMIVQQQQMAAMGPQVDAGQGPAQPQQQPPAGA